MANLHPASTEVVSWAQSLGGLLTVLRKRYGSVADMLEHPDWDEGKTPLALALITSVHKELGKFQSEMESHVNEKCG